MIKELNKTLTELQEKVNSKSGKLTEPVLMSGAYSQSATIFLENCANSNYMLLLNRLCATYHLSIITCVLIEAFK